MRSALAIALAALLLAAISAAPASAGGLSRGDRHALQRYAADTWHSFDLLVDPRTGLPDDNVTADGTRSGYTSPTNIGAYLWSTLGAREVGLISRREATARMARTLTTLAGLERGFFARGAIQQRIRPLLAMEQFTAGWRATPVPQARGTVERRSSHVLRG